MNTSSIPSRRWQLGFMRPALAAVLGTLAGCAGLSAPDAPRVIRQAEQAMGGTTLRSIAYAGKGTGAVFGQAHVPGQAWPRLNYSSLSRVADYEKGAFREDFARSRAEPNGGGATPLMGQGEARVTGLALGAHAWNMAGPAPIPAPVARDQRIHDLWTSPHGVLKAASKYQASAAARSDGVAGTQLSFSVPGQLTATAFLDAQGLVERVDSRLPHPVMGDTEVVTRYSDYRDHGGVKFPSRMRQAQGGFEVLDITFDNVKVNEPSGIETPALVTAFAERAVSEKVADGVWHLAGGSHNSVLIEMADHLVVVEAPLYDGRAAAALAEARRLVPGKPIRYVINSHHHFDHAGGLRTAIAEGATLVTSARAKPWFEKTFANANRIAPDLLARSGRSANIMGVSGQQTLSDGRRTIVIHEIADSIHATGFLMVYLPVEKLLVQADAFTPGAPNPAPPATPNANHVNLVGNIQRLNLAIERILPLHGRVAPMAELLTLAGIK
jgi:glyoxylase-like metal-dependent hydrolase (beta-lactamase superfamily II)